jgi:hypothetical protein
MQKQKHSLKANMFLRFQVIILVYFVTITSKAQLQVPSKYLLNKGLNCILLIYCRAVKAWIRLHSILSNNCSLFKILIDAKLLIFASWQSRIQSNLYNTYHLWIMTTIVGFRGWSLYTGFTVYLSQGFAEIRHFQKCLGFTQLPRQFQKCLGSCKNRK